MPKKNGRPPKLLEKMKFDGWDILDAEIVWGTKDYCCEKLNIGGSALDRKIQDKFHCTFEEYKEKKRGLIYRNLFKKQYEVAMTGNVSMLIWLGKQYLNQSEKSQVLEPGPKKEAPKLNSFSFETFCELAGYPKPFAKQIEMKDFLMNTKGVKMLLGARAYGKSDYCVVLGIAYAICEDPNRTFLLITKSEERNKAILREISRACETVYNTEFEIKNADSLRLKGLAGKENSVSAVTVMTCSLRGRHPTDVIFDDAVTPEACTEPIRLKLKNVYDEVVGKICNNVGIIGQPVHRADLYGTLRDIVNVMEVPYGSIPQLDPDLDAQRLAGVDESSILKSYFLQIPKEGESPFDNINYIDKFPTAVSAVAWIDPSFEGSDYTALCIMKAHFNGVAVVGFTYKKAWNHCIDDMIKRCEQFHVKRICFETNCLGLQPIELLRTHVKDIGVIGKKTTVNKHMKIMTAGTFAHMIHLSRESDKTFIDQIVHYEYNSKNDDASDALASCLLWLNLIRCDNIK
jgi:hypothetical protein